MARRFRVTADLLSNGFLNALMFAALTVATAFALPGAHGSQGATPVPANPQPVPTNIRNAPFSAGVSTEYDHQLANGNHIHRETRGKVARDSQGRVRTETEVTSPISGVESAENIAIQDPVLREVIHLDPHARVARVFHLSEMRSASVSASNSSLPAKQGSGSPVADPVGLNALFAHSDGRSIVEPLGLKLIEGVRATGTRTTRSTTNLQGEPVTAVTEVWFSTELQMVLLSVSDDGESGRTVMRLTNIRRTAPNEELFRVPPEYTIRDSNHVTVATKH
jgi:hypothetical protein